MPVGVRRLLANEQRSLDGQGRDARRPHLVRRQADHCARRRVLVQGDHDSSRADPRRSHGTDQLKWVEAYDDHTLVFFHKEPLATNTWNMLFPIIPKHVYENSIAEDPTMARSDYHTKLEDHPVVGGPYELVRRVRNQEFVVRRRESYYMHNGKQVRPKPYFKEVRFKVIEDLNTALLALKAGEIEEVELRAEQWAIKPTTTISTSATRRSPPPNGPSSISSGT